MIQSPNFPIGDGKSHYCIWKFEGPANRQLRIEFSIVDVSPQLTMFSINATKYLFVQLEYRYQCKYESNYVEVWEKPEYNFRFARMCGGPYFPYPLFTKTNYMEVKYASSYYPDSPRHGFQAIVTPISDGKYDQVL